MIGIDTLSWGKLIRLRREQNWKNIVEELVVNVNWFITIEGRKEFEHFYKDDIDILDYGTILPILNKNFYDFVEKGFDLNDASLLEYNVFRNYRIISEDRPMLLEGVTYRRDIVMLIDFFWELTDAGKYFSSRELYHLIKLFYQWKNIDKQKAKEIEKFRMK